MSATAVPLAGREPALVAGKPVDRPRDDGIGNRIRRLPLRLSRIIETEPQLVGMASGGINMGYRIVCASSSEYGLDNIDIRAIIQHLAATKNINVDVENTNYICLLQRAYWPLPANHPLAFEGDL